MRIYLVGYMCSGKTTIGRQLANKLHLSFVDTDQLFEETFGISVPDFLSTNEETPFREKEQTILHNTFLLENVVISTGGGLPCFFNNMQEIKTHGYAIFLDISPKSVMHRLQESKTKRPLLENIPPENQLQYIEEHQKMRNIYYCQAHKTIKSESIDTAALAEELKELLKG